MAHSEDSKLCPPMHAVESILRGPTMVCGFEALIEMVLSLPMTSIYMPTNVSTTHEKGHYCPL